MKWREFHEVAFPAALREVESRKSISWRINRWFGLRFAYVFYHLGFSANLLSITRFFLALVGFYLVALVDNGKVWEPILGVILLVWQINLDYADGPIARIQGKSSILGQMLDGLANAGSRAVVLLLVGFLSRSLIVFLAGAFAAYVLVTFIPYARLGIRRSGRLRALALLCHILLYVPVMVVILPMLIALHGVFNIEVVVFSYVVVCTYSLLALLWLFLCLGFQERGESVLERIPDTVDWSVLDEK